MSTDTRDGTTTPDPLATRTDRIFVGGDWRPSAAVELLAVVDPSTEGVIGHVPDGTTADVDEAVDAANAALDGWARTEPSARAALVSGLARRVEADAEPLARLITSEVGTPIVLSRRVQVGLPIRVLDGFAAAAPAVAWEERVGTSVVHRRPAGVVGCITPWNFPLYQMVAKLGAALVAGCTVVAKPSEVAPLDALWLAEACRDVGLPSGVLNIVFGTGPAVGEAIASHDGVDQVSFTGSAAAGRRVAQLAGAALSRVTLELGGKSANILLDDVDMGEAVTAAVGRCFVNNGQTCSALTRLLVPAGRHLEAAELAGRVAQAAFAPGDPHDETTALGPVATATQRDRVRRLVRQAVEDGADLVTGGPEPPAGLDRGWYVAPTVLAGVDNASPIATTEVFGPVLVLVPYEDEDDAVRLANDSPYGLSGGVSSADPDRARRVAERLRTGQVVVNGASFDPVAPFGGVKGSGFGRELGRYGIEELLVPLTVQG